MKKILALVLGAALLFSVSCEKKEADVNSSNKKVAVAAEESTKSTNEQNSNKKAANADLNNNLKQSNSNTQKTKDQQEKEPVVQIQGKQAVESNTESVVQPQEPAVKAEAEPEIQTSEEPAAEKEEEPAVQEIQKPKDDNICVNSTDDVSVSNQIGTIKNIYESNGKEYIDVDMVEFYRNDQAVTEAEKDGKAQYDDSGKAFIYDGYYIRNNDNTLTTYEVSCDTEYYLCGADVNSGNNSSDLVNVSNDVFNEYINSNSSETSGRATLCWVTISNGIVNCIQKQFTP